MGTARVSRAAAAVVAATALCASGLTGVVAAAGEAPEVPTSPDRMVVPSDPSATRRPTAVVGDALERGGDERAWVAAFQQEADGSGRVVTERVTDRAEAVAAVRDLQADAATTAVSVAQRVEVTTNDTQYAQQWAIPKLQLPTAWQSSRGAGVTVAVVDTGADTTHPDLGANLVQGADVIGAGVRNTMSDPHGHGTHVSGTIAAVTDNSQGVAAVAPAAKVMPVRVLDASGSGYTSDVAEGIVYAADHGASIINLSLGGSGDDPVQRQAVAYAQSKDVLVVAAAGNSRASGNAANYPAAIPSVTAVAATDSNNVDASFSNYGSYVDIAAPGVGIRSTLPGATYASWSGTSMATPHVAGVAALVRSQQPSLTQAQVGSLLTSTARDLKTTGWDAYTGFGLVDPVAALATGIPATPTASPTTTTASPTASPTSSPTTSPTTAPPTLSPTATPTPTPTRSATAVPTPTSTPTALPPPAPTPTRSTPAPVPGAVASMWVTLTGRAATVNWSAAPGTVTNYRVRVGRVVAGAASYGAWSTRTARQVSFAVRPATWAVQVYAVNAAGAGPTTTRTFVVRAVTAKSTARAKAIARAKATINPLARARALARAKRQDALIRTIRLADGRAQHQRLT